MGVREVASRESGSGQKKRHFGHTTSSQYYIIIILGQNMGFQNLVFAFGQIVFFLWRASGGHSMY